MSVSRGLRLLACLVLCTPLAVFAHHSVAYYSGERIELAGELTDVRWQNPHVGFALRTIAGDGADKIWRLESSAIFPREKDGVTRDLFRVGDRVKVFGRSSPHDAAAESRGIFRVWRPNEVSLAALPYTAAAIAARKSFDLLAAAERCGPEGMPRIMMTLFPYEFVDRGSEILVRVELYDTERIMDRTAPPPGESRSVLGYSLGEWRDGVLVIKTSLLNWPYFDQIGTPLSENVQVEERYTLSEDQTRLDVEITVIDPTTFGSPAIIRNSWLAYGDTLRRYDCRKTN